MACHFIRDYYSDLRKFQAMSIYITPVWQCFAAVIILTNPSWHNLCAYESCNPTTDRVLALLFSGHFFLLFFAWIRVRAIGSICRRRDADEQAMHACSLSANDKDQGLFHTWHGRYCFESRSIPGCEWNRRWVKPVCFNPPHLHHMFVSFINPQHVAMAVSVAVPRKLSSKRDRTPFGHKSTVDINLIPL